MKLIKIIFFLSSIFINISIGFSQTTILENNKWKLQSNQNKTLKSLVFKNTNHSVLFSDSIYTGPSWYVKVNNNTHELKGKWETKTKNISQFKNIQLALEYKDDNGDFLILATIKNNGHSPFQPNTLGIRLGIDTYLDQFPNWNKRLFPTLLRCEPTHFWGYFMGPTGKILSIISPDPIASWSHNYSKSWGTPPYLYNGHRITSVNLDLINALPLPKRHPQNLWQILPDETKSFKIYLNDLNKLSDLNTKITQLTKAPTIHITSTLYEPNEEISFSVQSNSALQVNIITPDGKTNKPKIHSKTKNYTSYMYNKTTNAGLYHIQVLSKNRKLSEASFYIRKPYSWYMKKAMQAVLDYPQKASPSHCESWYGFYTTYAGGKYFKNNTTVEIANNQFNKILPKIIDTTTFEPIAYKHRIQNISSLIGILVDRFQLYNNNSDLEKALKLSEFLLKSQTEDGAYRAHKTHYTSVIYIAKSLMELLEILEPLKHTKNYSIYHQKIYNSVKRAMDELERNRSNIQTEGEQTFEDGMISCSALQLGQFALLQDNFNEKEKYKNAALDMLKQHECLEQLVIPDARMRSASLRFWEAQYDVLMNTNFLNSPHGWSSWSTYAQYYAYLLTGNTKYLIRTFNGLGAAIQMINLNNGKLRWAFAVNPSLEITQIKNNIKNATPLNYSGVHYHAEKYPNKKYNIGEQYVDMVSNWFYANANDNDIHEHFKCLEEIALNKAYVAETKNGKLLTYNCSAKLDNNELIIKPSENLISKIHVNLKSKTKVKVFSNSKIILKTVKPQPTWILVK